MPKPTRAATPDPLKLPWNVVFFRRHREDDPARAIPGLEFLLQCPPGVQQDLFAILKAVAEAPPPKWQNAQVWQAMHGDMAGYFEARKKGEKLLYRVFCLLERNADGLPGPSVVIIVGLAKRNETAFTKEEYAYVRQLGDEYRARVPRSIYGYPSPSPKK
jgi:hypothetical protein